MSGTLFVVATPIGNLADITYRAVEVLSAADVIACEDTRVTRKLLSHYEISTRTVSCHAHSPPADIERLVGRLTDGEDVALVTDAGTPLLSDPGSALVNAAIEAGVVVVPLPGASALLAAVAGAGLPAARVLFIGFLPRKKADQREILAPLRDAPCTCVFYESPHRVAATLQALERSLGDRPACVARELTKRFETFERGPLSELRRRLADGVKGEVVIVVAPANAAQTTTDLNAAEEAARALLSAGERATEVAKTIAAAHGLRRKDAYALVLELKADVDDA